MHPIRETTYGSDDEPAFEDNAAFYPYIQKRWGAAPPEFAEQQGHHPRIHRFQVEPRRMGAVIR